MRRKNTVRLLILLIISIFGFLAKNGIFKPEHSANNNSNSSIFNIKQPNESVSDHKLAALDFKSGGSPYIWVNHNKSTLNPRDWRENKLIFGSLDHLGRTTTNTGYLQRRNLVGSGIRNRQFWRPTGWHQKFMSINGEQKAVENRGHLLAYSITGKFNNQGNYDAHHKQGSLDNPNNLATQSEFGNQDTMAMFEEKVRSVLAQKKKVIYQVSTIFKGNDLMPIGYHSQALSTDRKLDFNVFIWNVEPGVKFDYKTGLPKRDDKIKIKDIN